MYGVFVNYFLGIIAKFLFGSLVQIMTMANVSIAIQLPSSSVHKTVTYTCTSRSGTPYIKGGVRLIAHNPKGKM